MRQLVRVADGRDTPAKGGGLATVAGLTARKAATVSGLAGNAEILTAHHALNSRKSAL
jgi:hypothetical protein